MEIDEEVTKNLDIRMLEEEVGSSGEKQEEEIQVLRAQSWMRGPMMGMGVFGIGTHNALSTAEESKMRQTGAYSTGSLLTAACPQYGLRACRCPQTNRSATNGSCWCPEESIGHVGGASISGVIHNVKDGSTIQVRATMDQGNSIHPGVGISKKFFQETMIGYVQETKNYVTTATMGSILTRLPG